MYLPSIVRLSSIVRPFSRVKVGAGFVGAVLSVCVSVHAAPPASVSSAQPASQATATRAAQLISPSGEPWRVEVVCDSSCEFQTIYGTKHESTLPAVASPLDTTYSVHHMMGFDPGTGQPICQFINQEPPPAEPDDTVLFDGLSEPLRTDVLGTVPVVIEQSQANIDGTELIIIETSSPMGTSLFPAGLQDESTREPLTDGCFFIGIDDRLDWPEADQVVAASIWFGKDGVTIAGPFDLTAQLAGPWPGIFGISLLGAAGVDINQIEFILVASKQVLDPGACCLNGECIGDRSESHCSRLGGRWHHNSSCGENSQLPEPICNQLLCGFDNGLPLDDTEAPQSQYASDAAISAAAVDDFFLIDDSDNPCRIQSIRTWTTHTSVEVPLFDPKVHYEGVNLTIYENLPSDNPAGLPTEFGGHTSVSGGIIVLAHTIGMDEITATELDPTCLGNLWQLDIPIDITLEKNRRYWLEIQPIVKVSTVGRVSIAYSQNANGVLAKDVRVPDDANWSEVDGNGGACANPPAGTHRDLAFRLSGTKIVLPLNDDCSNPLPIRDGITPFSNVNAVTDGPAEPEMCDFFGSDQVGSDVWFTHVPTCTGELTISLCGSDYDTKLAVYDGCGRCPPPDIPTDCNDDACSIQSRVTVMVEEGNCQTIRIGGFNNADGYGVVKINCEPFVGACCDSGSCVGTVTEAECNGIDGSWFGGEDCLEFACPVPHDLCENCIPLESGVPFAGGTAGAQGEDVSSCALDDTKDVWHCWTPECTGIARISLCEGSQFFDTTLALFDSCQGEEIACNDDTCSLRSSITLPVTTGSELRIRVAGFGNTTINYVIEAKCIGACCIPPTCFMLSESDCVGFGGTFLGAGSECELNQGCCKPDGTCAMMDPTCCRDVGGIPRGVGSLCQGDGDLNGTDDLCETCEFATIILAVPPDGTVDARQPHELNTLLPRQGIGSGDEPIVVQLDPPVVGAIDCFSLCETVTDPTLGQNVIDTVVDLGDGQYEIVLHHAIASGGVTTLEYTGSGSFVTFTAHPANANADDGAGAPDIIKLVDYLNGVADPPHGLYSTDIDHSDEAGGPDIVRLIDLLNGASTYESWLNTPLPENTSCP